ncbi:MAG: phosphatidate cytidylyltransferase [Syntrophomonadaceae bacterium]
MLKTRIISAIVGIPIILGLLYAGGIYWKALFIILACVALLEYLQMMRRAHQNPLVLPAILIMLILLFSDSLAAHLPGAALLGLLTLVVLFVLRYPLYTWSDVSLSLLGAVYIGFLMSFALRLAAFANAFAIVMLCLLVTWGSDIGGYVFGRMWGKHKLTPLLSPNKTWEGALGALLLAAILAWAWARLVQLPLTPSKVVFLAIAGSICAQLGDLFESGMKRFLGAKDSGHIIPGHGGVLDRFDSLLLVVPLVYLVFSSL